MIYIIFINNKLTLDGVEYQVDGLDKHDSSVVDIHLVNDIYNYYFTVVANEVTINGIIQTSADMIIETLSNG